jgi:hypothetical protein
VSKPNVFIGGDSWGCGEWPKSGKAEEIEHRGIAQYFEEYGHRVVNTSEPDSSNLHSVQRLIQSKPGPNDIVLWIQSDPLRDLRPYNSLTEQINRCGGLHILLEHLIHEAYNELTEIRSNVNLIGGLFNIHGTGSMYPGLCRLVPSWINLLVGHMPEYQHTRDVDYGITRSDGGIRNVDLSKLNTSIAGQVINEFHYYDNNDLVFREDIFHPDGCHPNRTGHRILFEEIIKQLNL